MESLSIIGVAAGLTSLVIQITGECVKGFKFYADAVNMPEECRYVAVRFQVEQQRFLNFCLEAGTLYADGVICASLQIHRSLLVTILAEIKSLLDEYARTKGKYRTFTKQEEMDWNDKREPENDLMGLICRPLDHQTQKVTAVLPEAADQPRTMLNLGKRIARTGRNLRTVIVEPKHLIWVAIDEKSFNGLLLKLESLNSFLISLLDSSQIKRLSETVSASYLDILQIRNDVESLTSLVKALSFAATIQQDYGLGANRNTGSLPNTIFQEREDDWKNREYLKQLVEIKIKYTMMNQSSGKGFSASTSSQATRTLLKVEDFSQADLDWDGSQPRTEATWQRRSVWIEWKQAGEGEGVSATADQLENRVALLTDLLCYQKPARFRAPTCLGYVKTVDRESAGDFGVVFQKPPGADGERAMFTLRDFLGQMPKPSLSARALLSAVLARSVHSFHAVNWLHKSLRGDNILFFSSSSQMVNFGLPFISGFDLSRPSVIEQMSEKPKFNPLQDIYRHPKTQYGVPNANFIKSYDLYSLGLLLIEIAFWERIEKIIGVDDVARTRPFAFSQFRDWVLERPLKEDASRPTFSTDDGSCLQGVASRCSDAFRDVVKSCLTMDEMERPRYVGEPEYSIAQTVQRATEEDVVKKLEQLAQAMQ